MKPCARMVLLLLHAMFLSLPVSALAAPAQLKIARPATVTGQQNQVRVVVTATDHDGHTIKDLTAEQFGLSVDGVTAHIPQVEPATSSDQPLAIVLAMDVSGSMAVVLQLSNADRLLHAAPTYAQAAKSKRLSMN